MSDESLKIYSHWVKVEDHIKNLHTVLGEILEDAKDGVSMKPDKGMGFADVKWTSLNKAKRILAGKDK